MVAAALSEHERSQLRSSDSSVKLEVVIKAGAKSSDPKKLSKSYISTLQEVIIIYIVIQV